MEHLEKYKNAKVRLTFGWQEKLLFSKQNIFTEKEIIYLRENYYTYLHENLALIQRSVCGTRGDSL